MKILEVLTRSRIIGNVGERAAAVYLKRKGYKIIERNYVAENNEIDIIAKNRDTVVFVEVKSRTLGRADRYLPRPAAAVTPEKQQGIIKTAAFYLAGNYKYKGLRVRFDVIEVYIKDGKPERINHLENTFDKNTAYRRSYQ